jgi:hypothetical protein
MALYFHFALRRQSAFFIGDEIAEQTLAAVGEAAFVPDLRAKAAKGSSTAFEPSSVGRPASA